MNVIDPNIGGNYGLYLFVFIYIHTYIYIYIHIYIYTYIYIYLFMRHSMVWSTRGITCQSSPFRSQPFCGRLDQLYNAIQHFLVDAQLYRSHMMGHLGSMVRDIDKWQ